MTSTMNYALVAAVALVAVVAEVALVAVVEKVGGGGNIYSSWIHYSCITQLQLLVLTYHLSLPNYRSAWKLFTLNIMCGGWDPLALLQNPVFISYRVQEQSYIIYMYIPSLV